MLKKAPQTRGFLLEKMNHDEDKRTIEIAFSSEEPYRRWFGDEVLGHESKEVDLSRMETGAALLLGHNWDDQIGVVESVRIDSDKKGRAVVRFSKSARGEEIYQDVLDGIRTQVSVGYMVNEMKLIEEREEGADLYRVTDWQPYEVSLVSVAADPTVGVGRQSDARVQKSEPEEKTVEKTEVKTETKVKEETKMTEETKVDVQLERQNAADDAAKAERARVVELQKAGANYDAADLAQKMIESGGTIHDFNQAVLERKGFEATKAEDPNIGMSEKEQDTFSFSRLITALANPQDAGLQRAAGFELECSSAALAKTGRETKGAMIPFDVLTRNYSVGVAADGGNLVSTDLLSGSFIDSLENTLALNQCGATILNGLNGNIAIPRQTGGASHFWLAENGAPTESSATFDQIALTPKTVGAFSDISRRLLLQGSISAEAFVRNELALRLALALDQAGINGTGASNQPRGIMNQSGVNSITGGTNGAAPTWKNIVDLESAVANANVAGSRFCYLTNTKVRGKLKQTLLDAGSGRFIWSVGDMPVNGYDAVVSNQVPSNLTKGTGTALSAILYGNFADLIIGMWGGLDIQVDPYTQNTKGAVRVTAFQDCDLAVRHPESFAVMSDAITV